MSEIRRPGALRGWRAILLVLLGVLMGTAGSRMVRASGPEAECAAAPASASRDMSPSLPPEWRWGQAVVPLDRLYGTRRTR
jgi:hypothetical protein